MVSISDQSRRRGLWLVLVVGAVVVSCAAVWLWRHAQAPSYELPGLIAAVVGLFIGVAQVSLALLQLSRSGASGLDRLDPRRPGMVSLSPPDGLLEAPVHGRDEVIGDLSRAVMRRTKREPGVQVLHGMGGSGKTTVALAVARRARARGVVVWWISSATADALETGLRQLLRRLGATDDELRREWTESGPDLLWRRLEAFSRRWLLVIDNADDTRLLSPAGETIVGQRGWIRPMRSRRGMVMVTSREGDAATWAAVGGRGSWSAMHHIGMLSKQDSARVLLDRSGEDAGDFAEAARLGERLGGLALALRLAGAYLADTNRLPLPGAVTTFAAYRQTLDEGRLTAVFDADQTDAAAHGVISRTWELSLDLLGQRDLDQARPLLRLLAMFADAPIPYSFVLRSEILARSPMLAGVGVARLRGLLHGLAGLSLIDIGTAGADGHLPILRLHPLIRDTCRHHLDAAGESAPYLGLAVQLLAHAAGAGSPDDPQAWPSWAALTPHVLTCFHSTRERDTDADTGRCATEVTIDVARYLAGSGQYRAARDVYRDLVPAATRAWGETHMSTLTVRANLALWTGYAGDAVTARGQFTALADTLDSTLGVDHPTTLSVRANLADWTGHSGDGNRACAQFADLVSRYERIFGADHPDTLAVRANLAWWTGVAGHAGRARAQFADLLPLRREVLGADHPATLTASANLALWTGAAGDVATAFDHFSALLPTFVRVFGPEHPSTLSVRANLARWTGNAGDAPRALELYQELHPLVERVLGPTHPATLVLRANIALWTGAAGDPAGARRLFGELLPDRQRVSGPDHPSTLVVRANLAYWTIESGQQVPTGDRADLLATCRRVLGDDHPTTVVLQARFGQHDGSGHEAPPMPALVYNALIPIVERITGAEHPRTMTLASKTSA